MTPSLTRLAAVHALLTEHGLPDDTHIGIDVGQTVMLDVPFAQAVELAKLLGATETRHSVQERHTFTYFEGRLEGQPITVVGMARREQVAA